MCILASFYEHILEVRRKSSQVQPLYSQLLSSPVIPHHAMYIYHPPLLILISHVCDYY